MSWATSGRRQRLPKDWAKIRASVLKRAGYQCQHIRYDTETRCARAATDVDHIIPGDNHSMNNLQALCAWHHERKTVREAEAGRRRRRGPARRRPEGSHPASLE